MVKAIKYVSFTVTAFKYNYVHDNINRINQKS